MSNPLPVQWVVLRERARADADVRALHALGHHAFACPGIQVRSLLDAQLSQSLQQVAKGAAAIFCVSANAVDVLNSSFSLSNPLGVADFRTFDAMERGAPLAALRGVSHAQFWATGPGSAQALARAGVDNRQILQPQGSAPRDSRGLWETLTATGEPLPRSVLILRGRDAEGTGNPWLAQQLRARGISVHEMVVYERSPVTHQPQELRWLRQLVSEALWVCANGFALRQLVLQLQLTAQELGRWRMLCTHPRIVDAALTCGLAQAHVNLTGLGPEAWVASLQSNA